MQLSRRSQQGQESGHWYLLTRLRHHLNAKGDKQHFFFPFLTRTFLNFSQLVSCLLHWGTSSGDGDWPRTHLNGVWVRTYNPKRSQTGLPLLCRGLHFSTPLWCLINLMWLYGKGIKEIYKKNLGTKYVARRQYIKQYKTRRQDI